MMVLRDWLAGVAATALLGIAPAAAQAPRSLFEALPAPGAVPVTSGFQPMAPVSAKPDPAPAASKTDPAPKPTPLAAAPKAESTPAKPLRTANVPLPPMRPAFDDPAAGKATDKSATASDKARQRADRQRLANADPTQALPAEPAPAAPPPATAPQAAAAEPAPSKPMSRAERRRAEREAARQAAADAAAPMPAPAQTPTFATNPIMTLFGATSAQNRGEALPPVTGRSQIDALVSHHARLNNVPESLVHRVIVRESKYNPRAVGRGGAMGLMQIKTATARGVGYSGGPAGLLDAETNLTYGIKYLAGAWRVAGGSHDRAVSHYARGYYYEAKRQGFGGRRGRHAEPETTAAAAPQTPSLFSIFAQQTR